MTDALANSLSNRNPESSTSAGQYSGDDSDDHLVAEFAAVSAAMAEQLAGHERLIHRLLLAIITGGHVLVEGSPGLAKTRTVNCFAQMLNAKFTRVQATPDLLPADLTGTNVYQQHNGQFNFIEGPLFNNIVLMDEINRAPPKVQSALLEAMGEKQISAAGKTYALEDPFMVVATQNPIEHEGTYPLPEAQLDRFMFFVHVAMPGPELEHQILNIVLHENTLGGHAVADGPRLNNQHISAAKAAVAGVYISDAVKDFIVRLVTATRGHGTGGAEARAIEHAASPRGTIFLAQAAQARAWLDGRDHTVPDDVIALAPDILSGRIVLNYQAQARGISGREVIHRIMDNTAVL